MDEPKDAFMERTARLLSEMSGSRVEDAYQQLLKAKVGVVADADVLSTLPGQMLLIFTLNILARTFAEISLLPPLGSKFLGQISQGFEKYWGFPWSFMGAGKIQPGTQCDVLLAIGDAGTNSAPLGTVTIGCDGWIGEYRHGNGKVAVQGEPNPVGAAVTACFGAAQVFAKTIASFLEGQVRSRFSGPAALRWSAFSYKSDDENPPLPSDLLLDDVIFIGLGGVGTAAISVLGLIPGLSGKVILVDPDKVDESNLNRFLIATVNAIGRHKTEVVRQYLDKKQPGLRVLCAPISYQRFVRQVGRPRNIVVSSIDNEGTRAFIQSDLPKIIIDAATSGPVIGLSRHNFIDGACLGCLHPRPEKPYNQEMQMAKVLGWPLGEVINRLADDEILSPEVLQKLANYLGLGELTFSTGKPLRVFWAEDVCGKINLPAEAGQETAVGSAAFVTTLAGALAAGELIKNIIKVRPLDNELKIQVFQGPSRDFPRKRLKDPKCGSLCYEEAMRVTYLDLHGSTMTEEIQR